MPSLRHILFAVSLMFASMAAPIRIEQVNELMRALNRPRITRKATVVPIDQWKLTA